MFSLHLLFVFGLLVLLRRALPSLAVNPVLFDHIHFGPSAIGTLNIPLPLYMQLPSDSFTHVA